MAPGQGLPARFGTGGAGRGLRERSGECWQPPGPGPLALCYSLTAAASECIFGQLTPHSPPRLPRSPRGPPTGSPHLCSELRTSRQHTRPAHLGSKHWLKLGCGTAPPRRSFDKRSAEGAGLELAMRPRPLSANAIGPGASSPERPWRRPRSGAAGWTRLLSLIPGGPKARVGARLGNWSTLTLKPRPVTGGIGGAADQPRKMRRL